TKPSGESPGGAQAGARFASAASPGRAARGCPRHRRYRVHAAAAAGAAPSIPPRPALTSQRWSKRMAKEELLEFDGPVTEGLPDGNYRGALDNAAQLPGSMSGRMRKFRTRTGVGDRVVVEVSPYDLSRGRINFRHKGDRPAAAAASPQRRPNFRRH